MKPVILNRKVLPTANSRVYYVYMLLDIRFPGDYQYGRYRFKYRPLYCGMGYGNRSHTHAKQAVKPTAAKTQKNIRIRNILKETGKPPAIRYMKEGLLQQEAFDLECKLVQLIGRHNLRTGPLTNLSDGGEGQKNIVHTPEYRERRTAINNRIWAERTEEEVQSMVQKNADTRANWTPEQKKQFSKNRSNGTKKQLAAETPEQKRARSAAYQATCAARTPEEQKALSHTLSTARKEFFSGMTDQQYYSFQNKLTKKRAATWASLSKKERALVNKNKCSAMKAHWDSMTEEQRLAHSTAISIALNNRGESEEKKRRANISKGVKAYNVAHPKEVARKAKIAAQTRSNWTPEQFAAFCAAVSKGHAARSQEEKAKSSKKMSRSGKLRVAAESKEVKEHRSAALSKSHKEVWDNMSDEERARRSQSLVESHAQKSEEEKTKVAKKISKSVSKVHATRTTEEKERIEAKIALTLMLKHKTITDKVRTKVWTMYNKYDFSDTKTTLLESVIRYIYKQTGRAPKTEIPELLHLNSLGKKDPAQLAKERSVNRKAKLSSMSQEETARSRSRTGLTLMYKNPNIAACNDRLERLFDRTDFSIHYSR